jgi:hypothetical protein
MFSGAPSGAFLHAPAELNEGNIPGAFLGRGEYAAGEWSDRSGMRVRTTQSAQR